MTRNRHQAKPRARAQRAPRTGMHACVGSQAFGWARTGDVPSDLTSIGLGGRGDRAP